MTVPPAEVYLAKPANGLSLINHLAADDGRQDPAGQDFFRRGRGKGEGINIHDCQISPSTLGNDPRLVFAEGGIGRPAGIGPDRFFDRQPLLWIPSAGGLKLLVLAGDRAMESVEDSVVGARIIGIECQSRAVAAQRAPGIGAKDALRAEAIFGSCLVLHRVGRFH